MPPVIISPAVQAAEQAAIEDYLRHRLLLQAQAIADLKNELAVTQQANADLKEELADTRMETGEV